LNWRIVAVPVSIIPFIITFLIFRVSPQDIFQVGIVPFAASAAAVMTRFFLQAYRFKYFIRSFVGRDISSTAKTLEARLAGEFVTFTTPSLIGGEVVRVAWMAKMGVPAGKATWITIMEIIADVFAVTILAFIAGALAVAAGAMSVGVTVIAIAAATFGFWLAIVLLSARRVLKIPAFAERLVHRFAKKKADDVLVKINNALVDLSTISRDNFSSPQLVKKFAVGLAITFVAVIAYASSFLILIATVDPSLGLFDSLNVTTASTTLGNLPVTIGGSGLAELGALAYIQQVGGIFDIEKLTSDPRITAILAWRIASYHVPLVITWIAFLKLAVDRKKPKQKKA
jgi:glycosyltransferase 2 family protein